MIQEGTKPQQVISDQDSTSRANFCYQQMRRALFSADRNKLPLGGIPMRMFWISIWVAALIPTLVGAQASDAEQPRKVRLSEGTEIYLVFSEAIGSGSNVEGDRFNLRVEHDVKVDGIVVIPRDAIAVGTVTHAKKRRRMGKAGELSIMLDYVKAGEERVRLRANKTKEGEGRVGSTVALTVLFGPLGLLKRGKNIDIKIGTPITAFVDQDEDLIVPD